MDYPRIYIYIYKLYINYKIDCQLHFSLNYREYFYRITFISRRFYPNNLIEGENSKGNQVSHMRAGLLFVTRRTQSDS